MELCRPATSHSLYLMGIVLGSAVPAGGLQVQPLGEGLGYDLMLP